YVGTEHLLLGLIREGEGVAAKVLLELGVDRKRVREETLKLLGGTPSATPGGEREERPETPALNQFGRDLTQLAREAKLDPVIGLLHTLVGAGGAEGAIDASNMLKPALARGELQCIGATTLDEYRKYIEKDGALERRFQPIMVDQPSVDDTIQILMGLRDKYEAHHGVKITDEAVVQAVKLADRYMNDRYFPDKAIDVIDE